MAATIADLGEKRLLGEIIIPLLNPEGHPFLPGDDCGIVDVPDGYSLCTSTDRVPWDLIAYQRGIISERQLGYYLAVLNLSDIAAMGADAAGLLLNLALPASFHVKDLMEIIDGVREAAAEYRCPILGGDLSDSSEPSLVATSLGVMPRGRYLRRAGANVGDAIFITGTCGLTATAFEYFLRAEPAGLELSQQNDKLLRDQFQRPIPRLEAGSALARSGLRVTAMDNTDGLAQSLSELAAASRRHFVIEESALPVHQVSIDVAKHLGKPSAEVVLGPGADFHLVGTIDPTADFEELALVKIGEVEEGSGMSIRRSTGVRSELRPIGWNYFRKGDTD